MSDPQEGAVEYIVEIERTLTEQPNPEFDELAALESGPVPKGFQTRPIVGNWLKRVSGICTKASTSLQGQKTKDLNERLLVGLANATDELYHSLWQVHPAYKAAEIQKSFAKSLLTLRKEIELSEKNIDMKNKDEIRLANLADEANKKTSPQSTMSSPTKSPSPTKPSSSPKLDAAIHGRLKSPSSVSQISGPSSSAKQDIPYNPPKEKKFTPEFGQREPSNFSREDNRKHTGPIHRTTKDGTGRVRGKYHAYVEDADE